MERLLETMFLTAILIFMIPSLISTLSLQAKKASDTVIPVIYSEYAGLLRTQVKALIGSFTYNNIASFEESYYGRPEDLARLAGLPVSYGGLPTVKFAVLLRPLAFPTLYREVSIYILKMPDLPSTASFEEGVGDFLSQLDLPSHVSIKTYYITSYTDWQSLVESLSPPKWIVIINPYDVLPVPLKYAGNPLSFIDMLRNKVQNYGWSYVNTKGYPFVMVHVENGANSNLTVNGLNQFLTSLGLTASSFSTVSSTFTAYGQRAYGLVSAVPPSSVSAYAVKFSTDPSKRIYTNYAQTTSGYYTLFLLYCNTSASSIAGFLLNAATNRPDYDRGFLSAALAVYSGIWFNGEIRVFTYGGQGESGDIFNVIVWLYRGGRIVENITLQNYADLSVNIRKNNPDLVVMLSRCAGLSVTGYFVGFTEPSSFVKTEALRAEPQLLPSPRNFSSGLLLNIHTYAGVTTISSDVLKGDLDGMLGLAESLVIIDPKSYSYSAVPLIVVSYPSTPINLYSSLSAETIGAVAAAHHFTLVSVQGTPFILEIICGE